MSASMLTPTLSVAVTCLLILCSAVLPSSLAAPSDYLGYSAICVVAKDENRYIREWLEYHS